MTDALDRVLPVTLTVCAALLLLTLVACVVAAVWLDLTTVWRWRRGKGARR